MRSFRYFREEDLISHFMVLLEERSDTARRLEVLNHLRRSGRARGLAFGLQVASGIPVAHLRSPSFAGPVKAMVTAVLRYDPGGWEALPEAWAALTPELRALVLDALEGLDSPRLFACLEEMLRADRDAAPVLLARMVRAPVRGPEQPTAGIRSAVRAALHAEDPPRRRLGALAAARLHLTEEGPRLVKLLEDDRETVSAAAHRALRDLSGLRIAPDPEPWRSWLAREEDWRSGEGLEALLAELASPLRGRVADALVELRRHRWCRDELVEATIARIGHEEADLRALACRALGHLRHPSSLEALKRALRDEEGAVRTAAAEALTQITGLPATEVP